MTSNRSHGAIIVSAIAALALTPCIAAQQLLLELKGDNTPTLRWQDQFGISCVGMPDIDGDGVDDLLVGAGRYNTKSTRVEGAAFVFSGMTGAQVRKHIGYSKFGKMGRAVDGGIDVDADDVPDYVVGESFGDRGINAAGIVHVYSGATGTELWTFDGENSSDSLGESVALIPDIDGDGHAEIVATAHSWDNLALGVGNCGRGYCWSGRAGTVLWTYDGTENNQTMWWCTQLNDVDGDGIDDVAFGSTGIGAAGTGAGKVELVSGASGSLIRTIVGAAAGDAFGLVRGCGDLDGDGIGDLIVGSMNANSDRGRIAAHSSATGLELHAWDGTQKDQNLNVGALRALRDWDGDGFADPLIGSSLATLDDCSGGWAQLRSGRTGRLLFEYRSRDDLGVGPTLGDSASTLGDLDGDGIPEIVVGASAAGPLADQDGRLYVFAGDDLFLQADQSNYDLNDPITIELRGGTQGVLGMIAITELDGAPLFVPLVIAAFDGNGELAITDTTDSTYLGHSLELAGWALPPSGRGKLIDSNVEWFRF